MSVRYEPKGPGDILENVLSGGGDVDIAATAKLFGDPTRACFCTVLLDGRFRTAGELAKSAEVAPSTASEHLSRLVEGGVLETVRQGRHRYYRLAGAEVAAALEALAVVSPARSIRSLRQDQAGRALRAARTCYDHLAGRLGVELFEVLLARGVITDEYTLGDPARLAPLKIALPERPTRPLVRPCLDWTERRYHAAGALPAALTHRLFELAWLERIGQPRAVRLTPAGKHGLAAVLDAPEFAAWDGEPSVAAQAHDERDKCAISLHEPARVWPTA